MLTRVAGEGTCLLVRPVLIDTLRGCSPSSDVSSPAGPGTSSARGSSSPVLIVALSPKLKTTADQSEFLPDHYESIKGFDQLAEDFPDTNASIARDHRLRPRGRRAAQPTTTSRPPTQAMARSERPRHDLRRLRARRDPTQPDLVVVPSEERRHRLLDHRLLRRDLTGYERRRSTTPATCATDVQSRDRGHRTSRPASPATWRQRRQRGRLRQRAGDRQRRHGPADRRCCWP